MGEVEKEINIIQFTPYFPPHIGGLETVAQQWSVHRIGKKYGRVTNVTFSVGQRSLNNYTDNGYEILVIPAFELISNYPFPKIRSKKFWEVIRVIKQKNAHIYQTHTRFFLSSLLGGILAKVHAKKWVHIEHGSSYVQVDSWLTNMLAKLYDTLIGSWVFRSCDICIAISQACKIFIQKHTKRNVDVIYRGLKIPTTLPIVKNLHIAYPEKILIGCIGRMYKWKNFDVLIKAYYHLPKDIQNQLQIVIVGDGEDMSLLKKLDIDKSIHFTGGVGFDEALAYQKQFDIHIHTSSPGGGLATTLLQAMYFGLPIIASPHEGAKEVVRTTNYSILLDDTGVDYLVDALSMAAGNDFSKHNADYDMKLFRWDASITKYKDIYLSLLTCEKK